MFPLISILAITGTSISDVGGQIIDWFYQIGQAIVNLLIAPFQAIADIFGSWASSIGSSWFAPIIMAVVAIATLVIFYFGFKVIDTFFN